MTPDESRAGNTACTVWTRYQLLRSKTLSWQHLECQPWAALSIPYTTVYMYYIPLGWFSELDCSTTNRVPIPNDTSWASQQTDNASESSSATVFTFLRVRTWKLEALTLTQHWTFTKKNYMKNSKLFSFWLDLAKKKTKAPTFPH